MTEETKDVARVGRRNSRGWLLIIFVLAIALVGMSLQLGRSRAALRELTAAVQELLTANEELRTACAAQTAACSKQTTACAETTEHLKACLDRDTAPSAGTPVGMVDTDGGKGTWSTSGVSDGITGIDLIERRLLVKCLTDAEIAALPDRSDVCIMSTESLGSVLVDRRTGIPLASCDK